MKAVKIAAGALVALIAVFLVIGLTLPKDYDVKRSTMIDAGPLVVFDQVNDVEKAQGWNPWKATDPTMVVTLGEKTVGVGASYSWTGERSGDGKYAITKSEMNKAIESEIDFGLMGRGTGYWTFVPVDDGTKAVWGIRGETSGVLGAFYARGMDSMLGPSFEQGLAALKK